MKYYVKKHLNPSERLERIKTARNLAFASGMRGDDLYDAMEAEFGEGWDVELDMQENPQNYFSKSDVDNLTKKSNTEMEPPILQSTSTPSINNDTLVETANNIEQDPQNSGEKRIRLSQLERQRRLTERRNARKARQAERDVYVELRQDIRQAGKDERAEIDANAEKERDEIRNSNASFWDKQRALRDSRRAERAAKKESRRLLRKELWNSSKTKAGLDKIGNDIKGGVSALGEFMKSNFDENDMKEIASDALGMLQGLGKAFTDGSFTGTTTETFEMSDEDKQHQQELLQQAVQKMNSLNSGIDGSSGLNSKGSFLLGTASPGLQSKPNPNISANNPDLTTESEGVAKLAEKGGRMKYYHKPMYNKYYKGGEFKLILGDYVLNQMEGYYGIENPIKNQHDRIKIAKKASKEKVEGDKLIIKYLNKYRNNFNQWLK